MQRSVVPILCGSFGPLLPSGQSPIKDDRLAAVMEVLRQAAAGCRTLVVAAGDLSHVGPAFGDAFAFGLSERARLAADDATLLGLMARGDGEGFFTTLAGRDDDQRVCGLPPVYWALQLLGECQGVSIGYTQCAADATGDSLVSIAGVLLT